MTAWLAVVGIGEDGLGGLSEAARRLVEGSEVLIGGERHLAMVPDGPARRERLAWPSPLSALVERIVERRGRRVCVLASGDPMCYGVGVTLARRVSFEEMTILPAPGAFALACARLGWPRAEIDTLTLHGRPIELLHAHVQPGARLLVLSADRTTPESVAALLRERGYGPSRIAVLEHLGGPRERIFEATAESWAADADPADLNTIAVECRPSPGTVPLPRVPGLPDEAFRHDGQMTKREVRAATLAVLAPVPGQVLWDVGAGSGSIAIEWARVHPTSRAVAIERRADRLAAIAHNAHALGVPHLRIVEGEAPEALAGLPRPDAVFIGGGLTAPGVAQACWDALGPGGRLAANAVTVEGEHALFELRERIGGTLVRLAVSRAEPVGGFTGWRPMMPVTQLSVTKT
ncbi:precorrin-6y C5,15-methyltransferase (decarboxylating) subunit CbiE [Arenibaculum sp.]|jgi:precorrin-6Y C5,15-methyltransferase (decarboxylating)|uniref:precorrin-6y C5,15-methyltransferase (decarboxylating) subunit CbiE n=1 Tax=Arenibaculum sp. TaxID=2865862 RepID=UPI002E0DA709|nr:precorrin-6y C5,15-methyltransferase (decarboxylating) subunit CbiE [Arenibaculum sp.]